MKLPFFIFVSSMLLSCANQTSPGGGPQDKKPPELITSNPKNNQKNFNEKGVVLVFDEYVKLKDHLEEILITPAIGKDVKFVAKKNKVTLQPRSRWKEKTTYSISFREGIQDITESNSVFNLRLAFSTGPEIDSLSINGKIEELFKDEIPDKITVAIYSSDTFNIFKHQPTYFTRANKQGRFSINNLKSGRYFIYAFEDKNKNLKVERKGEKFGFVKQPIDLEGKSDSLTILLSKVDYRPIKITSIRPSEKLSTVRINKEVNTVKVEPSNKELFTLTFGGKRDELLFYKSKTDFNDSLELNLQLSDSIGNKVDTTLYLKFSRAKVPKEKFKIAYSQPAYNYETKEILMEAIINKPVKQITFDSTFIQLDSTRFQQLTASEFTVDTLFNKIKLKSILGLTESDIKDNSALSPVVVFGKGAFISIENDSTSSSTLPIKIKREDQLGSIEIDFSTKEKNYMVQIIGRNNEIILSKSNIKSYTFKYLEPQEYKLRIIIDSNGNNKWDPGNFENYIEPERVIIYRNTEGKSAIPLRANWEVGPLKFKF